MPSSSRSAVSHQSSTRKRRKSTKDTTLTSQSKSKQSGKSSTYDPNFGQLCLDYYIYPIDYEHPDTKEFVKPINLDDVRQVLKTTNTSDSQPVVTEDFREFKRRTYGADERIVMVNAIRSLLGISDIRSGCDNRFSNLASITGDTTVNPQPDFFDGADTSSIDKTVRDALYNIIVPNQNFRVPVVPNFFLEVKGQNGTLNTLENQTVLNGAYGAHIMHKLQNYLLKRPSYDEKAHAFSSTLIGGYLDLFAHHLTGDGGSRNQPRYHTTLLASYPLNLEASFIDGVTALRNLRAKAKEDRDLFIAQANQRDRERALGPEEDEEIAEEETEEAAIVEEAEETGEEEVEVGEVEAEAAIVEETEETEEEGEEEEEPETQAIDAADALDERDRSSSPDELLASFTHVTPQNHNVRRRRTMTSAAYLPGRRTPNGGDKMRVTADLITGFKSGRKSTDYRKSASKAGSKIQRLPPSPSSHRQPKKR